MSYTKFWRCAVKRVFVLSVFFAATLIPLKGEVFADPDDGATRASDPTAQAYLTINTAEAIEVAVTPGVFNSASSTVVIGTNNFTGYTMAFSTVNANTDLVHTQDSSATIPTITLPSGRDSILASEFSGAEYGYSLNGTDYMPVVNDVVKTGSRGTDSFGLTIGVLTETNTLAGDYERTLTITAVANAPSVAITYDQNTTDTVINMPAQDEFTLSNNTITVSGKTPVRDGYDFLGWEDSATNEIFMPSDTFTADPTIANVRILTAIWELQCTGICYDGNGDDGTGSMAAQNVAAGDTATLRAPNFRKPGYGFLGWNTKADGTGILYGPNETISVTQPVRLWLYATWIAPEQGVTLQTFNKEVEPYSSYEKGTVIALRDERDGNVYAVAKLADENWWITENLRLNPSDANTTITTTNSNNPSSSFVQELETTYKGQDISPWKTCSVSDANCYNQISYSADFINMSNQSSPSSMQLNTAWYSYGVLYNWYTANGGGSGDICPAGWHLPTGGNGEFRNLDLALGGNGESRGGANVSANWRKAPYNFTYAGYIDGTSSWTTGSNGNYWSSTPGYRLVIYNDNLRPGTDSWYMGRGHSVRCIANSSVNYTLSYDANQGTGAPSSQSGTTVLHYYNFTISNSAPTRSGYNFLGWSTDSSATAADYQSGATITVHENTTLYAVWEKICNGVCYVGNSDDGTGTMPDQTPNFDSTARLWAPNFSKPGYGFAGWNTEPDGTGTMYGPNEKITMPASGKIWLYAIWVESTGTLQGFDCNTLASGAVTALADTRDNQTYAVAKLADGKCWMTENLRLNPQDANTTIDSTNTNNPSSGFVSTIANNYKGNESVTTWNTCNYASASCFNQVSFSSANINRGYTASPTTNNQTTSWYAYGMLYNWYTATTGYGTYNMGSGTTAGDICPTGWHLPHGKTGNDLEVLSNALADAGVANSWKSYPNNFVLNGYYYGANTTNRNSFGYYWTATAFNPGYNSSHNITIYGNSDEAVYNTFNRSNGAAVRCLVEPTSTFTLSYDANGGEGEPVDQSATDIFTGHTFTISSTAPTRSGYGFLGWSTDSSATAADYQPSGNITVTDTETTLYAVWEELGIVYHGNGDDGIGTMDKRAAEPNSEVMLDASNFSRPGYGFAGWNTKSDGTGTLYGPNQTITMPGNGKLDFYAHWVASAGDLQSFDCSTLTAGAITALTDTRDNQTYAVSKLADGKCWMIENLRLDLSNASITITANNTNSSDSTFITAANNHPASTDSWCAASNSTCNNQIVYSNNNITRADADARYSYGVYYNWYTATAGNGLYETVTRDAIGDICPAGWHLPTGAESSSPEFGALSNALGGYTNANGAAWNMNNSTTPTGTEMSKILRTAPNNFIYSGVYSSGSSGSLIRDRGIKGYYWTTRAFGSYGARLLLIDNIEVNPGTATDSKYEGGPVRCLAN